MLFRLTDHELDEATRTLRDGSGTVHIEPQVYEVLAYLVAHRDRAVSKSELLRQIWGDEFVSESALTSRIKSARAALGDTGRDQRHIRTVHGFGYQFVSPVIVADPGDPDDGPPGAAAPTADRSTTALRGLPVFHSAFHGRERERSRLTGLVLEHRLVTALGPGGIGKTRLAVQVVADPEDPLRGLALPVVFVDLAPTRDPAAVPDTIALTLGIEIGQRGGPVAAVCEFLSAIPHLVVIDNCEHVQATAADLTREILAATSLTRVLATSRMPLGVEGECLFRIGPLPVVAADDALTPETLRQNPAAAIFLDRASLVDDSVLEDPGDAGHVAQVCRTLEGVPLALELAAGRVAAFGLADLLGLLDRSLDVLGDRSSVRDERHRTLRATVGWSYGLLDDPAQRLLRFLSVFPGGVTLDCIESIAVRLGLGVSGIEAAGLLVDGSLVTRERAASGTRYSQLETLRAFGVERLEEAGEREQADELLVAAALDVAARVDRGLRTADEAHWTALLREELANVRAARRCLADADRVGELSTLLRRLTDWARLRDSNEFWAWVDDLVARVPPGDPHRPAALAMHAQASWRRGDISGAIEDATAAIEDTDDPWVEAHALSELASARMFTGALDQALDEWSRAAEIDPHFFSLGSAALATAYAGRLAEARERAAHGRAVTPWSPSAEAWFSYAEGEVENAAGAADTARLERAIAAATSVDASFIRGVAMVTLASVHATRGETALAARTYEELVRHWLRSGSWTQQWTTLRNVAGLIEDDHPGTALDILRGANADPLSSSVLVGPAAEAAAALCERLLRRVPDAGSRPARPRVQVAEDARRALLDVAGGG